MYNDGFRLRYGYAPIAIGVRFSFAPTEEHFHNEIEMLLIEKGSCTVKIGNNTYEGKAGDLFFINPTEKHSLIRKTEKDYFHKCIVFDTELIADKNVREALINGDLSIPHHFKSTKADTAVLTDSFLKLFEVVYKNKSSLLFEVMMHISAIFLHLVDNSLLIQRFESNKEKDFYLRTTKYISENYSQKLSSKDIAEALFYSQTYFCRAFKKCFGVSFTEHLNMYRVFMSKDSLLAGDLAITEISSNCGFDSSTYFSRIFKKYIGMTPTEFQKVNSVR